jgi:hypothetical protein
MAGAAGPLASLLAGMPLAAPAVPVISCVEPGPYPASPDAVRALIVRHATAPVNFVGALEASPADVFVQVGAGSALLAMARSTLTRRPPAALVSLATLDADDGSQFTSALVELAVRGLPVDLRPLAQGATGTWLPAYPLETESYRVVTKKPETERAVRPAAEAPARANDSLVALFREQMAVLQAQVDIIRRQNEALNAPNPNPNPNPIPHPNPIPNPIPIPHPNPATATAAATATAPATVAVTVPAPAAAAPPPPAASGVGGHIPRASDKPPGEGRLLDLVSAVSAFPRSALDLDKKLSGDLGFDSLMVVELAGKLADAFPGLGTLP